MNLRKEIKKIAGYISKVNKYTKEQEEQIEYTLRVTVFEFLKIAGIILIYSIIGYPSEAFAAVIAMAAIRPFIGGYHEDTQLKCFVATLIVIGSVIYLSNNLKIDFISKIILNGISLYCIWNEAPVINSKMPFTKPELVEKNMITGIVIAVIFIFISIVFNKYKVSDILTWTMIFQSLLLFNKRNNRNINIF